MTTAPPYEPPPNYGYNTYPTPPRRSNNWVKWVIIGVIVLVVILGLCCFGLFKLDRKNNPTPLPSVTTTTSTTIFTTPETDYLAYVHKDAKFSEVEDTDIVSIGHDVCISLRGGNSVSNIITILNSSDIPQEQSSELVKGAVIYLCPDQKTKLPVS